MEATEQGIPSKLNMSLTHNVIVESLQSVIYFYIIKQKENLEHEHFLEFVVSVGRIIVSKRHSKYSSQNTLSTF